MTDLGVDVIQGRVRPGFHPPQAWRDTFHASLPIPSHPNFIFILPGVLQRFILVLVDIFNKMCGADV